MAYSSLIEKTETGVLPTLLELAKQPFPTYPTQAYGQLGRLRCRSCLRDQDEIKDNLFEHRNFCHFLGSVLDEAGIVKAGALAFEVLRLKEKLEALEEKTQESHAHLRKIQSSLRQLEMDFSP